MEKKDRSMEDGLHRMFELLKEGPSHKDCPKDLWLSQIAEHTNPVKNFCCAMVYIKLYTKA